MPDFVKRCQSRVKSLLKAEESIPMGKCREVYQAIVANYEDPTEEELGRVVQALIDGSTVEVTSSEAETTTIEIATPETFDIPVEDLPCLQPPVEEAGAITNEENFAIAPEGQEASSIVPQQPTEIQPIGSITQADVADVTQAITQAIQQVGQQGNAEAVQLLTSLADELSSDIQDTQEMVTALVTAYLGKRQQVLSSAVGALNSLRTAQTESFQAGLDQSFFGAKDQSKREFLSKVGTMFN